MKTVESYKTMIPLKDPRQVNKGHYILVGIRYLRFVYKNTFTESLNLSSSSPTHDFALFFPPPGRLFL